MEANTHSDDTRRHQIYLSPDDVLVRVLDIPEADYECILANSSWVEKGLLAGDVVLCEARSDASDGDIVLIEENGEVRLGVLSTPGYLETPLGFRMLEPSERIIGVGIALSRKLAKWS